MVIVMFSLIVSVKVTIKYILIISLMFLVMKIVLLSKIDTSVVVMMTITLVIIPGRGIRLRLESILLVLQ